MMQLPPTFRSLTLTSGLSPTPNGGYVASPSTTSKFVPLTLRKLHIFPERYVK